MLPRGPDSGCEDHPVTGRGAAVAAVACVALSLPLAPPAPPVTGSVAAVAASVHEATVVIGTSVQGRPIRAVHRWTDGATRSTVVVGSIHGDERAGMRVVRRLRTAALPAGVDLWLVRTMNPDGTAADRRTNGHGVDLNRNFPTYWERAGAGTATWSGPTAASEPETRAAMTFLRMVAPRTTLVFHQPLFGVDSYRAKSMTLVRRLSRLLDLPVRSFDCAGGCHGTLTDWHNRHLPGRAVTIELGPQVPAAAVTHYADALLRLATP
jgi:succinylglutamate desuccinylase